MPIVTMPDNTQVSFPDDMPPDQIKGLIQSKFPDAVSSIQGKQTLNPNDRVGQMLGAVLGPAVALANKAVDTYNDPVGTTDNTIRSLANAVPGMDRLAAYAASKTGIGGRAGDYEGNLANERARDAKLAQDNPVESAGGRLIGTAALGAALSPLAPVAAAIAPEAMSNAASYLSGSVLGRSALGAGIGGGIGGVYGAFESPDLTNSGETISHAARGALGGAAIGAAAPLVASGIGRLMNGQQSAEQMVASRTNISPEVAKNARDLLVDARNQGMPLTLDEAIAKANGGPTGLTRLNRVVSNSTTGGPIMDAFYNQRPAQIKAAGEAQLNAIAPDRTYAPAAGLQVQSGAKDIIDNTRKAINASEGPFYREADSVVIPDESLKPIMDDPKAKAAFNWAKNKILANNVAKAEYASPAAQSQVQAPISAWPTQNRAAVQSARAAGLTDDQIASIPGIGAPSNATGGDQYNTIKFLSDVRDMLGEKIGSLQAKSKFKSARDFGPAYSALDNILKNSSDAYAQAKSIGSALRQSDLAPLENSIIGDVAGTSDLSSQASKVFSPKYYGQGQDASRLAGSLSSDNPQAADSLLYQHLQDAFNNATAKLQGGPNVMGAAKFAKAVAGNDANADILQSYIQSRPKGDTKWNGLRKFLDIAEATGYKPAMGSNTSPDIEINKELGQGGLINIAKDTVKTLGSNALDVGRRLSDWATATRLGNNKEQIARLLTDPRAEKILERIGSLRDGDPTAKILAYRLTFLGNAGASDLRNRNR